MAVSIEACNLADPITRSDIYESGVVYKSFKFSAGETQVRLSGLEPYNKIRVWADTLNAEDLIELVMALDAIHGVKGARKVTDSNLNEWKLELIIPYLPYSRQDRRCVQGEAFSLQVIANMLLPYFDVTKGDRIETWDVHSSVAEILFTQKVDDGAEEEVKFLPVLRNIPAYPWVQAFGVEWNASETLVISPDDGAKHRANEVAFKLGLGKVACAEKVRDPSDGSIKETRVSNLFNYTDKDLLIVDDICDGGRTFIELAKVLRQHNPRSISLYVTHGIFSKGFEVFGDLIDKFYVANLFPNYREYSDLPSNLTYLHKNFNFQPTVNI